MAYPFQVILHDETTSGGSVVLSYQVPNGRRFTIHSMIWESDDTFNLVNLYTTDGRDLGNMSNSNPVPSTMLYDAGNDFNRPYFPIEPLVLDGGSVLYAEVIDTGSVANDIWLLLNGLLETA